MIGKQMGNLNECNSSLDTSATVTPRLGVGESVNPKSIWNRGAAPVAAKD